VSVCWDGSQYLQRCTEREGTGEAMNHIIGSSCNRLHGAAADAIDCFMGQVGDWGAQGTANQTAVADAMAQVAQTEKANFIISTGNNFDGGEA
jgi:hypothetical protein